MIITINTLAKSFHNYGPIKRHNEYRIVAQGRDHYVVGVNGKRLAVPIWVFEYDRALAGRDRALLRESEEWDDD